MGRRSMTHAPMRQPPGEVYPQAFQTIDIILRIIPAAAAPAIVVGINGGSGELGWTRILRILVVMLTSLALATFVARRAWAHIRADARRSVRARTVLGGAAVV